MWNDMIDYHKEHEPKNKIINFFYWSAFGILIRLIIYKLGAKK